tara:strand:- start:761 stop:1270 length:510 start_codon:yes stop_codon:yes gene_type:complete
MSEIREKVKEYLLNIINDQIIIKEIEKGIYNYTIIESRKTDTIPSWTNENFIELYRKKSYSILGNLDTESYIKNDELIKMINDKKIIPYDIAFKNPEDIYPTKWEEILKEKEKINEIIFSNNIDISTDIYQCHKCKERKCTYYQLQTRGADEPMTTFVTCLNCNKRWKC